MRSPCHQYKPSEVERQEASTEGKQTLTGPSTAALTASFSGTLIGPLMAVEKVVKAMKMESVLLSWHSLYHSLLCVYLGIITFSLLSLCSSRTPCFVVKP